MSKLEHTIQLSATINNNNGDVEVLHGRAEDCLFSVYERKEGETPFEWIADFISLDTAECFVYARAARTGAKVLYQVPGGTARPIDEPSDKYVRDLGLICPTCESNDIVADAALEVDVAVAWGNCYCNNCHSTWQEVYSLTGIDNHQPANPSK